MLLKLQQACEALDLVKMQILIHVLGWAQDSPGGPVSTLQITRP